VPTSPLARARRREQIMRFPKKKYLLAMTVLGVAVVAVFGMATSGAWWTDTYAIADNTLASSGNGFNVEIRPEAGTTLPIHVEDLTPCEWTDPSVVGVFNLPDSSCPVKYRLSFTNIVDDPAWPALSKVLCVRVHHYFAPYATSGPWVEDSTIVYEGPFRHFVLNSTDDPFGTSEGPEIVSGGVLDPNITHVYAFEFQINSHAGNKSQCASTTFDLQVDAYLLNDPTIPIPPVL
jgi:hypothetical protein